MNDTLRDLPRSYGFRVNLFGFFLVIALHHETARSADQELLDMRMD